MKVAIDKIKILDNTRESIDKPELKELAESMKSVGLLQPIIVRTGKNCYELIAGHRRFEAAKLLQWKEIDAVVNEAEDYKVLQVIENLQRKDINPMEEARAIQELMVRPNSKSPEKEIAALIGKSPKYVLQRNKLNLLVKKAQEYLLKGQIELTAALELCKYPKDYQDEIIKNYRPERIDVELINDWMDDVKLLLTKASFDLKDDKLTKAGSCEGCQWRSSASPLLFEEKKDTCMNAMCYAEKELAYVKQVMERLKKEGKEVIYISDQDVESTPMIKRMSALGIKEDQVEERFYYKKSVLHSDNAKKLEAYEKKNKVDIRKDALRISSPGAGKVMKVYLTEDLADILTGKKKPEVSVPEKVDVKAQKEERLKRYQRRVELSEIREFHEIFKVQIDGMMKAKLNFDNNFEALVELLAMNFYDGLMDVSKLREYFELGDQPHDKIKDMIEKQFAHYRSKKDRSGYLTFLMLCSLVSRFPTDPEYLSKNSLAIKLAEYMTKLGIADPEKIKKINSEYSEIREKMKKNFDKNK